MAPNHSSYLDAMVLTALLPPDFAFVVKRELEKSFISRLFLRRLGALFVERFDAAQSAGETVKALRTVESGESLVIFPEGTFRRYPGSSPSAWAPSPWRSTPACRWCRSPSGAPARSCGEARSWSAGEVRSPWPRRSPPEGTGWHAGVQLRDRVRAAILERCGEPDLGE